VTLSDPPAWLRTLLQRSSAAMPSDRLFGLAMTTAAAALAGYKVLTASGAIPFLLASIVFALGAMLRPKTLRPLNVVFFCLGQVVAAVAALLSMVFLYFIVVTPIGLVMRALGKLPLRLKRDLAVSTYWVTELPGPERDHFRDQF
jgi:ABC-type uncharacterized transport system permease subunit